ncbi:MAG: hypothetical protein ABFS45_24545 [Pseudomonadota bacterium]
MINRLVAAIIFLGCWTLVPAYAGGVMVSSGTSVDLTAHRRPYATVLKPGMQDFNVVSSAIVILHKLTPEGRWMSDENGRRKQFVHTMVFYSDNTWSIGTTNRVDSLGIGKYVLPPGYRPDQIVGAGSAGPYVYLWFSEGTTCRATFPRTSGRDKRTLGFAESFEDKDWYFLDPTGTFHCGSGSGGKIYGYTPAHGKQAKDIVGVAIDGNFYQREFTVFAYYRDGTVSAGTSDDLDSKRAATEVRLPGDKSPFDIIDVAIDGVNHHVYAFYRDKPKRYDKFRIRPQVIK